ncbi:hypothetical protein [Thermomonospora umbrina]|uniref:Uncharacterized protein n=1 Tax=Thermomonospora umbrina TaxID=111806 RepID=A0A3D9SYJ3_9ACTN|nr:hypothetical protein [Thermomonospora umbrina]REE99103.1 hypothetical protein DFJ69_4609 [Thermomonospora umbrina]
MKLVKIAGPVCDNDDCPTVYRAGNGMVAVQGDTYTDSDMSIPARESVVLIPEAILLEAARALGQ